MQIFFMVTVMELQINVVYLEITELKLLDSLKKILLTKCCEFRH